LSVFVVLPGSLTSREGSRHWGDWIAAALCLVGSLCFAAWTIRWRRYVRDQMTDQVR
jgi:hypothetical protein